MNWNLTDNQKQILREIIAQYRDGAEREFTWNQFSMGVAIIEYHDLGKNHQTHAQRSELESLRDEGLISFYASSGTAWHGLPTKKGYDAVDSNFAESPSTAVATILHQNFHAPVGAVQNAPNASAIVNQNLGQLADSTLEQLHTIQSQIVRLADHDMQLGQYLKDAIEAIEELKRDRKSGTAKIGEVIDRLTPWIGLSAALLELAKAAAHPE
jgi:hypothetical protein